MKNPEEDYGILFFIISSHGGQDEQGQFLFVSWAWGLVYMYDYIVWIIHQQTYLLTSIVIMAFSN